MSAATQPTRAVDFDLAGYRGSALAGVEGVIQTRLLPAPEERAREGRTLRETTGRVTSRVSWEGVGAVLLKVHRARSSRERWLSLVRKSRARAEWEAARLLFAMGAPVPQPLAIGEQRRTGMVRSSFFVARFLDGLTPVHDAFEDQPRFMRARLHQRLAGLIAGLHDRGFDHRDLHSGNVLVGAGPGDACRIVVTDLHRSDWGDAVGRRARRRAVAQWLHSLPLQLGPGGRMRWIRSYLGSPERKRLRDWTGDVEARIARMERTRLRSRGKRCFKNSTVYTPDVGDARGWRRRDLPLERLARALAAHDAASAPAHPSFVKRSRRGLVTRHGDLVVKERLGTGFLGRLRDRVHPRRHASGYANAHRLGVRGIDAARPLAWVRREGRTYTLFEDLSVLPRLDHLVHGVFRADDRAARRRLLHASADWLAGLHRSGIYHGDLKGVNVLVECRPDAMAFKLIDTDRCRFLPGPVDRRHRIKNLSQLAASMARCLSRTDRLRWYRRYAAAVSPSADEKQDARDVAALLARKILVVDEPIE